MLICVVCFTCNKVIGSRYTAYLKLRNQYRRQGPHKQEVLITSTTSPDTIRQFSIGPPPPGKPHASDTRTPECRALDDIGLHRLCCRSTMMTCIDLPTIAYPNRTQPPAYRTA